jgi:predicted GIY-YIG superfamily endonuclease
MSETKESSPVIRREYTLQLAEGKYYVGRTTIPLDVRLAQHLEGKGQGSAWTAKYPPIKIIPNITEQLTPGDADNEDILVRKMMRMHGRDNVRGGSYSQIELPTDQMRELDRLERSRDDRCFGCGGTGHFINQCPNQESKASSGGLLGDVKQLTLALATMASSAIQNLTNTIVQRIAIRPTPQPQPSYGRQLHQRRSNRFPSQYRTAQSFRGAKYKGRFGSKK